MRLLHTLLPDKKPCHKKLAGSAQGILPINHGLQVYKSMAEYYDPKTYPKRWNYLQSGTLIDEYMVERELVHGGFSSVYLGRQLKDQIQVAIKEYLPRKIAHRTWNNVIVPNGEELKSAFLRGRALFFEEAKVLAEIKHPNIVEVINFFEANQTAYIVMTYYYGVTLEKLLKFKEFIADEAFILTVFEQLFDCLQLIHDNKMVHLDIKPGNILIRPGSKPLLLDFGAIQTYPLRQGHIKSKVLTKGFSPIEQHSNKGDIGPWTDIYALGASMFYCLDGKVPDPSPERQNFDTHISTLKTFKKKYSNELLETIDWALQIQPSDRPQSISEFRQKLSELRK